MIWIDTHAHYNMGVFAQDRDEVLQKIFEAGVETVICPAVDFASNFSMYDTLLNYEKVYFALGIHPKYVLGKDQRNMMVERGPKYKELERYLATAQDILLLTGDRVKVISKMLDAKSRIVAIGETGLDYSYSPREDEMALQSAVFRMLIELALKRKMPLILHVRDAHEDALGILKSYNTQFSGVIHCFRGDEDLARQYLELGFVLGIGTSILDSKFQKLEDVIYTVDMDKIVLETDAPYLTPDIMIDERNTSLSIPLVAKKIADIKGIGLEQVADATYNNARRVFHI